MLGWVQKPSSNDPGANIERLKALEAAYGPVTELDGRLRSLRQELASLGEQCAVKQGLIDAYGPIESLEVFQATLRADLDKLTTDYAAKREAYDRLVLLTGRLDDALAWQDLGVYEPVFSLDSSESYQRAISENLERQKTLIREKSAVVCRTRWQLNGSTREGEAMIKDGIRLALRAFNNECDAIINRVTWRNAEASRLRVERACEQINGLMASKQIDITAEYLALKLEQLALVHEHTQKVKDEREEARRIRELERQEAKAQREFEEAIKRSEEEEDRYERALRQAREELGHHDTAKLRELIEELEAKLQRAIAERERAKSMAQMTRSGYVYVISNIGSFGQHVFKVGMTRRIEPMDRVQELGDASVPFAFDVHALIWTTDAPELERSLHKKLEAYRVNQINYRKEFFSAPIDVVRSAVRECASDVAFVDDADAEHYRLSLRMRGSGEVGGLPDTTLPKRS